MSEGVTLITGGGQGAESSGPGGGVTASITGKNMGDVVLDGIFGAVLGDKEMEAGS